MKRFMSAIAAISIGLPGACGDSGLNLVAEGGIGGTGITIGPITGFGSIFVNGVEFATRGADIVVNDKANQPETALHLGMVVRVRGSVGNDGRTGVAESVAFSADLEGPIADVPVADSADPRIRSFPVLGTTVRVQDGQTVFDDVTFASLAQGQFVEISGFSDATLNVLSATRVERKSGDRDEVRLKGTIRNLTQAAGMGEFALGSVTVTFDAVTELPPGGLNNGRFVRVEGNLKDPVNSPDTVAACKIDTEDDEIPDDVEASISGIVGNFRGLGDFRIDGQTVDARNAEFSPPSLRDTLANGARVEVEGVFSGGVLVAKGVESRATDIEIEATISTVDTARRQLTLNLGPSGTLTVLTDAQTLISDDAGDPLRIDELTPGDFLQIKARRGESTLIANRIEHDEGESRIELEGPVDGVGLAGLTQGSDATGIGTVTVLDVTFGTDASTELEPDNFFSTVSASDVVRVRDEIPGEAGAVGDGIAEQVEIAD